MKNFNLEEYIKNPNQILVLEHYKEPFEYWPVKAATVVMGKRLAISTPETGYVTDEIEIADGDVIRDEDHNLVGYIRVAEPGDVLLISINTLSQMVANMKVGDTIDFNCREDSDCWGIHKIHILGADVLVIGSYGGGSTCLHDLTIDCTQNDVHEFLTHTLDDKPSGDVYWEIPKPKDKAPQEIILLYSADAWRSHSSMRLEGVFSGRDTLNSYLNQMKCCDELTDYDLQMLSEQNQTQGRDTNYLIETETINPSYGH